MAQQEQAAVLGPSHVKALKIAVVVMGVMILVGLAAVIGRIIYLAGGSRQAPSASASAPARSSVALPAGAAVRQMALSGDRLAVHFESPGGPGILVLDVATGATLARIDLVPEPPR